jgi:hypothetical protein
LVHVQYGDACPEIPLPNTGGAGSNFHRLPSGVRRVILSNNGVSVSTIVAFYSAGRDFLMTFIQST